MLTGVDNVNSKAYGRDMETKAIETVHTMTMRDGTVVTTTWHDTRAAAAARIAEPAIASWRKVLPGGCLGAFRAVTWS